MRFVAARLDAVREMACDQRAAVQSGDAIACADALLATAGRISMPGHAEVNAKLEYNETPLINAARSGSLPLVEYLVGQKADVNLGVFADGHRWRSPLNQASTDAIREYLASKGAVAHK